MITFHSLVACSTKIVYISTPPAETFLSITFGMEATLVIELITIKLNAAGSM